LGEVAAPTLFQRLVFGGRPGLAVEAGYSFLIVATVFGAFMASAIAMFCIWWERKVSARIQSRHGPNRVGPVGMFQSPADGLKLVLKEDLIPGDADRILFRLAPYLAFAPVFAAFLVLPFGPDLTFEPRLAVGLFWILAVLSIEVIGIIMAGWASNNKWAVYGAMREACQMVSYEIPLGLSILIGVMTAGTLNLVHLGFLQQGGLHTWLIFRNPFALLAFFVFFVASLASNKRAPFDLPESESELVAGYHTEYSGIRFSFFFLAEYCAMFVVAGIQVALFLGGWNDPFGLIGRYYESARAADNDVQMAVLNVIGAGMFAGKVLVIIFVQMWIRWTLPRPRIDQVLYACIKVLLPFSCALLLGAALWQLLIPEMPGVPWVDYNPWHLGSWVNSGTTGGLITQSALALIGLGAFGLTMGWIGYAFLTGGGITKRLTDPAPIDADNGPAVAPAGS
jgi:NADH-quinone oxidoreductase subunit H